MPEQNQNQRRYAGQTWKFGLALAAGGLLLLWTIHGFAAGAFFLFFMAGVCVLGNRVIDIDRASGRILVTRFGNQARPLQDLQLRDFQAVRLVRSGRRGRASRSANHYRPSFDVRLAREQDQWKFLNLRTTGAYRVARQLAEDLSIFTGLPLEDQSGYAAPQHEAGHFNDSLRETEARTQSKPIMYPRPISLRSEFIPGGGSDLKIVYVGLPFGIVDAGILISGMIGTTVAYSMATMALANVPLPSGAPLALPALFALVTLVQLWQRRARRNELELSGGVLTHTVHVPWRRVLRFSQRVDQIKELALVPARPSFGGMLLVSRTDQHSLRFGHGLPVDEVRFLYSELRRRILSAQPPAADDRRVPVAARP